MRRIFLSGPVRGKAYQDAVQSFRKAELWVMNNALRKDEVACIVNPLSIVEPSATDEEAMSVLLPLVCSCDTIVLLPGHEFSEGSKIEANLARYLHKTIVIKEDL